MNFVGFEDAENLSPPNSVMNAAAVGSGGGSGGGSGSQNDPNHNIFLGQTTSKCDPFSFLDDDDDVEQGLVGKPLRSDHAISLEDLVRTYRSYTVQPFVAVRNGSKWLKSTSKAANHL